MQIQKGRLGLYIVLVVNLAVVAWILALAISWWRVEHVAPIISQEPVKVEGGIARQGDKVVGWLQPGTNKNFLKLTFADQPQLGGVVNTIQFIGLQGGQELAADAVHFESIQGTEGMWAQWTGTDTVQLFVYDLLVESHTSATIAVDYGKPTIQATLATLAQKAGLLYYGFLALAVLIITGQYVLIVRRRPGGRGSRELQATPPANLSPLEVAILSHSAIRPIDISAMLWDLAHRGYLEIISNEEGIVVLRTSKAGLSDFEESLLGTISYEGATHLKEVLATMNKNLFSKMVSLLYVAAYTSLKQKQLVIEDIPSVHLRFKTVGIIMQLAGLAVVLGLYFAFGSAAAALLLPVLAVYLGGYLVYWVGYQVLPLSPAGIEAYLDGQAFARYLRAPGPIDQLTTNLEIFYLYLPYAQVFNEVKPWFERFAHQDFSTQSWFTTDKPDFQPLDFIEHVEQITDLFARAFVKLKDPNVD